MSLLRRLHPLDLGLAALGLLAVVYLLVTVPGYRWARSADSGLMRLVPYTLTILVQNPAQLALAQAVSPGPLEVETSRGLRRLEIVAVEPDPAPDRTRLRLRVIAEVDGAGRAFFAESRLRAGDGFSFADAERRIGGTILEARRLAGEEPR